MGSFNQPPLMVPGWMDTVAGMAWLNAFWKSTEGTAGVDGGNTLTGVQVFSNGSVNSNGPILLSPGGYYPVVDIEQVLTNNIVTGGGGSAGLYVQVSVDNSVANGNTLHSGIRVQLQTMQQVAAGVTVNGAVGGYFGLYNDGVGVGAFGYHTDLYHAGSGAASSSYGASVEMYRTSSAGFTVGAHVRSIGGGAYLNNDYGFLASPGGSPATFTSAFAAGSQFTGTCVCQYGVDLRQCDATTLAQIRLLNGYRIAWGDDADTITAWIQVGASDEFIEFGFGSGNPKFSITNPNGIPSFAGSAGSTAPSTGPTTGTPLGSLLIAVGGSVYKVPYYANS